MPTVHLFTYPDTASEPIDFTKFIEKYSNAVDSPSYEQIKKINDLRSRLINLLNTQPNTKAILDVIDEYVPELIKILPFIEHNRLQNLVKIKWRSSLSASIRTSLSGSFEKPFIKSYSIYYEIIYVQMAYAFILSNMAVKKVVGECSDEILNAAINDLCKAAGIFQNLAVSYSSAWAIQDGPPETTSDSLSALADMSLGDAQQLACMKAERKNMSAATIMKLKAGVIYKYDKCLKTVAKNSDDYEDFSRHFKSHITHVMKYVEGNLLLAMAKANVEKDEYGPAVAQITAAHNMFIDCKEAENSNVSVAARELIAETEILHSKYTRINNSVCYQRVPEFESIRAEYLSTCKIIVDPKRHIFGKQETL